MSMVDLTDVVNDADLGEPFTVQRSQGGYFGAGGWSDNYVSLNMFGIISIADDKTVDALPEADRIHEVITIRSAEPVYVTRLSANDGGPATSDIVIYQGPTAPWGTYRVIRRGNYASRGFWRATATRMAGA